MSKGNGGPAFPTGAWEYDDQDNVLPYQEPGMTLRDYFASKAMQMTFSTSLHFHLFSASELTAKAKQAYRIADAMLEAGKK